jgi:hypothetical protein
MLTATTVGVFFIPLFFAVIRGVTERWRGRAAAAVPAPAEEGA